MLPGGATNTTAAPPAGEQAQLNRQQQHAGQQPLKQGQQFTSNNNDKNENVKNPNNCLTRGIHRFLTVVKWVLNDFRLRHLVWIKFIFFFQSASMTVLYPYLNLHMKSLGLDIVQVAIINAVIPVLFIFTPPLAGFLADKVGNFRALLSVLTALGGVFALLLLSIPPAIDHSAFPASLKWGISCGRPGNRARFQKLMLHGFQRDECQLPTQVSTWDNVTFTPGTCGYLCPTRSRLGQVRPRFAEYKVIWPNRGGGFGLSEIVDVVNLDSDEARIYHEPDVVDNNIFFPMNWTFHLSCDSIRTNDCIFNPITRAPPAGAEYTIKLNRVVSPFREPNAGPSFDVLSIEPPEIRLPVTTPINCGAKEVVAQVVSKIDAGSIGVSQKGGETYVDTRFSGCGLHCLVNLPRNQLCNNTHAGIVNDPSLTFWTYLTVRTVMGVLTAASLMMFEGAVMATVQEMGGDYGIQRFVGNFGAIVFAPLGGYVIDATGGYNAAIYIYLALKIIAAVLILLIRLDFKPPGERILNNVGAVARNAEAVAFLGMMMFAGTFWGYIEAFLFWHLDDMGAQRFLMGWTVAVGMVTSLPFLIFSGPITDTIGHMNVIILGMLAYTGRMLGYSFIDNPIYVYPFEALEGLTMALMMTSAVTYVANISTPDTIASVMGMMGALFFGVGKASGALFGGLLMDKFMAPWTFRFFAINALVCAITYGFFQCMYVRPKMRREKEADQEASEAIDEPPPPPPPPTTLPPSDGGGQVNKAFTKSDNPIPDVAQLQEQGEKLNRVLTSASSLDEVGTSGPRSITGGTRV